jgi:transposase
MLPFSDTDDPRLPFDDLTQQRYEVIRPVVVTGNRTVSERAQETGMHPDTVSRLKRRFEKQGMLGLIPGAVEVVQLYFQGWSKTSISGFLHVSRPTINEWICRLKPRTWRASTPMT